MAVSIVGASAKHLSYKASYLADTVPYPAGTQSGDLVVFVYVHRDTSGGIVTPSGFTFHQSYTIVGTRTAKVYLYYRWLAAPVSGSIATSSIGPSGASALMIAVRGLTNDGSQPFKNIVTAHNYGSGHSISIPGFVDGCVVAVSAVDTGTSGATSYTPTITDRLAFNASNWPHLSALGARVTTAIGNQSFTAADNYNNNCGFNLLGFALQGNSPPTAPTNISFDGQVVSRSIGNTMTWDFNDPDPGDTQSRYIITLDGPGGAIVIDEESTSASHLFAADSLAAGAYTGTIITYDAQGAVSPPSAGFSFTVATAPSAPTLVNPAGVVNNQFAPAEWSTSSQQAFQVQRVADVDGVIGTEVYQDSGQIFSTATRAYTLNFDENDRWEWVRVRVRRDGLWSNWTGVRVEVTYTQPAGSEATVTAYQEDGRQVALQVDVNHPEPEEGAPATVTYDLLREKREFKFGLWTWVDQRVMVEGRPVSEGSFIDGRVEPFTAYRYRVVAIADNGTRRAGQWSGYNSATLIADLEATLTGFKQLQFSEEFVELPNGDLAVSVTVKTYSSETPDPAITEGVLQGAGIQYTYELLDGATWNDLAASGIVMSDLTVTWDELRYLSPMEVEEL